MSTRASKNALNVASDSIEVVGFLDQDQHQWLRVTFAGSVGYAPLEALFGDQGQFWQTLSKQRVTILDPKLHALVKRLAQHASFKRKLIRLDRSGWFDPHYLRSEQTAPARLGKQPVVDVRPPVAPVALTKGSQRAWRDEVARLAAGQPLLVFALACGFASLLLPFVQEVRDNPLFEFYSGSSIGKSLLLELVASIFGPRESRLTNWNLTSNGLEPLLARRGHEILLLDEVGKFVNSGQHGRRAEYCSALMHLGDGVDKQRFGAGAPAVHRFLALSSSNVSVAQISAYLSPMEASAVQVRMMTINADAGAGLGVFSHLPQGCTSGADAAGDVSKLGMDNYGWAARAFLRWLEYLVKNPLRRVWLLARIRVAMKRFNRAAKVDGNDGVEHRIAQKFALVAAAGSLAARTGILPFKATDVEAAVLAVYDRRQAVRQPAASAGSALDQVHAYLGRWKGSMVRLDEGYPELTDAELDAKAGFLKSKGRTRSLLIRSARWQQEFGARSRTLLDELKAAGHLYATEGLQSQHKVRANRNKDRVYQIAID